MPDFKCEPLRYKETESACEADALIVNCLLISETIDVFAGEMNWPFSPGWKTSIKTSGLVCFDASEFLITRQIFATTVDDERE